MIKVLNFLMILCLIYFISSIFKYYYSNKNLDIKKNNRANIDQILKEKISNLPVLANDTNNVIEFNNTIETEKKNEKKRNFWDLLKIHEM